MARVQRVTGVRQVIRRLRAAEKPILDGVGTNLKRAGLFVQRESQKRVPVNTGNLKNSAYVRREGITDVRVGYTAAYALMVHENVEMKLQGQPRPKTAAGSSQGMYWDPQGRGQAKFLENAFRENLRKIRQIVRGKGGIS